jgi:hypothetical protein
MNNKEYIPHEEIPDEWHGRCTDKIDDLGIRPCSKCREYPNVDGDDDCIANLGTIMNACCGHGERKGYIQFDSGIIIRGHFEIEKFEPYDMPYKIRPRKEILDRIKELRASSGNIEELKTLEWVVDINDDKDDLRP